MLIMNWISVKIIRNKNKSLAIIKARLSFYDNIIIAYLNKFLILFLALVDFSFFSDCKFF